MLHSTTMQYAFTIIKELKDNTITVGSEFDLVTASKIAEKHKLKIMFVEQIFRKLKTAGIVIAHRGPGGGYELARKDVNVHELYMILDTSKEVKVIPGASLSTMLKINEALASIIV